VLIGILPSLVWLSFFRREDCHPEPKYLITKTFLMGIIISPIAIIFQFAYCSLFSTQCIGGTFTPSYIFWAATVEELVKFFCVVLIAIRSPEFDEPVDGMIYMISAALGFAAIENILFLFKIIPDGDLFSATSKQIVVAYQTIALRSLGATLLHALSSAIIGYFLAMSWFFQDHRKKLIITGLIIGSLFHFAFNIFLSNSEAMRGLIISLVLLAFMGLLVSVLFYKAKDRHSRIKALTKEAISI
jgi:RsiW-degrading membrane proteinase PrsW (M82 family)